jgi:hypothetical protein
MQLVMQSCRHAVGQAFGRAVNHAIGICRWSLFKKAYKAYVKADVYNATFHLQTAENKD